MYGEQVKAYPNIPALQGRIDILGIPILKTQALVIVTAFVLMLVLFWFVERTRTGRAMRAVSEDKDTAALMGINVDRTISTTFAIGGLLAGAAGVLYALIFGQVHWFMGFLPGIKAFTAAVLGGIGNIVGAMLGGLTLGLLEQVGPNLFLEWVRRAITKSAAGRHRVQRARPGPDLPAIRHPREAGEPLRCLDPLSSAAPPCSG